MATPLAPPAQPLSPLAPLAAPAAAQAPVVELPLQTPGSAVQLQEAAQLRGGPVPMVPWYSGIGGDAPVLAKAEVEKVRKLRDEFEGASAEYRVLSQVAVAGMTSKEGKSLQKRFKELEQAWGAFQWNQKSRSLNPTTREEVQAASAALAAQPKGVDLEHEVETVLAELWDSLEKPVKPRRAEFSDPQLDEELDRLEAYIEARIHEEEKAEREGREAKSRPKLAVCATQSEVLGDMSAKFQQSHPMGLDEGTGGTPMTSYTAQEEVHVLPGSGAWFDHEVQHLSKEVHSVSDKLNKDSSMLEASVSVDNAGQGENAELVAAIQAERRTLARQCQCIAAWTFARLEQMREQYNEIFARMDDWIKDRVREENEAIKETERQLRTGKWEDEEGHQTISRTMTVRRSHTGNVKPAPSSAAGKRRRDVLKVIVPKTLDVNVYVPPKLEVLPSTDTGSMVRSPSTVSQGLGKMRSSFRVPAPEKWSQEMMWGLLTRLTSNLEMGACDAEQLMKALLERRHGALGFENEQVIPPSWVQRPLAVYHLLCRSFVEPAWGATQVDLTEFFLALTHHENFLTWPTMEALEATRSFLHSEESSLSEEELAMYPDVDVSEELFCQLPLWPGGCPSEMRRWMFQVLCCFSQAEICLPPKPGGQDTTPRSVTARRIIGYFGLANAPAKAFSQFCRLLLPAKLFSAAEEDPSPQVLVKDLWTILYSQRTRPAAMMAPVPDLATFCNNLIDEGKVPDAVPKAKAKAKGKAKPEVEEETEAPVIPEEATVAFSEQVLMSRQTVLKALLSHGGLLCRRRGLDMLFPNAGSIFPLKTSAEAEALKELQSLVPEPPPEEEAPAEVAEGS